MTAFLYFAPGVTTPKPDLEQLGVAHAFDRAPQTAVVDGRTPTGAKGLLIFDGERLGAKTPGFYPDEQTWRPMPKLSASDERRPTERVQVGYYAASPPNPKTLLRRRNYAGQASELGDGQRWVIPRLRAYMTGKGFQSCLPVNADVNDEGEFVMGGSSPEVARLDEIAERLIDGFIFAQAGEAAATPDGESDDEAAPPKPISESEGLNILAHLLGANYVVSRVELAMLGVLSTDDRLATALGVACSIPEAMASVKNLEASAT